MISLLVALFFFINGYEFGVIDHAIHLPFLMRELDPSFLRGDPLLDAYATHPSFFWKLQAVFVRWIPVETLYLGLHVLSVAGMMAGTAAIARALLPREAGPWAPLLAACCVLMSKTTAASVPMMDSLMLNRTVVLGPLLFALAWGIERRYHAALLLCGLAFLIHPTSAVQVAFMVWFAALWDAERRRAVLTGPWVFLAAASPLLVSMVRHGATAGVPSPPPEEWVTITRLTVGLHHYPGDWPFFTWLLLFAPLALLVAALRAHRSRPVELYLGAVLLMGLAAVVGTEGFHLPLTLQLHLLQSTRYLSFLAAACGARWILDTWPLPGERRGPGVLVAVFVVGSQFLAAIPLLVVWGVGLLVLGFRGPARHEHPLRLSPRALITLALVAGLGVGLIRQAIMPPALQIHFAELRGARLMEWSRTHLPADAVVAIPPYFIDPLTSFRYGAGRAIVGTLKDGGEASFNLKFMTQWKERIEALCGCTPFVVPPHDSAMIRGLRALPKEVLAGYRQADAARFRMLATRFGATHAVIEAPQAQALQLPLEYEDDEYKLYRITP